MSNWHHTFKDNDPVFVKLSGVQVIKSQGLRGKLSGAFHAHARITGITGPYFDDWINVSFSHGGAGCFRAVFLEHQDVVRHGPTLDESELSVRAYNCLKNADIAYLGDLQSWTSEQLLKTKNFGRVSLQEVRAEMVKHDMYLEGERPSHAK